MKKEDRRSGWYPVGSFYKGFSGETFLTETVDLKYGGMSFEDLRAKLDQIEKDYSDQFEKFKVEIVTEYDYGGEVTFAKVMGFRSETDKEYETRVSSERAREEAREQREREEFERLARKFGEK